MQVSNPSPTADLRGQLGRGCRGRVAGSRLRSGRHNRLRRLRSDRGGGRMAGGAGRGRCARHGRAGEDPADTRVVRAGSGRYENAGSRNLDLDHMVGGIRRRRGGGQDGMLRQGGAPAGEHDGRRRHAGRADGLDEQRLGVAEGVRRAVLGAARRPQVDRVRIEQHALRRVRGQVVDGPGPWHLDLVTVVADDTERRAPGSLRVQDLRHRGTRRSRRPRGFRGQLRRGGVRRRGSPGRGRTVSGGMR